MHSYVTLLPPADMSASTTIDSRTRSDISMSDSSTDASSLSTCILAAGSDVINPQFLSSVSDVDTSVNSASEVRRISADTKDHTASSTSSYYVSAAIHVMCFCCVLLWFIVGAWLERPPLFTIVLDSKLSQ